MKTNDKVSVNDSKLGSRPNFWLLAEIMKRGEEGSGVVHVDRKQSDRGPVDPLMKSRRANESRERGGEGSLGATSKQKFDPPFVRCGRTLFRRKGILGIPRSESAALFTRHICHRSIDPPNRRDA